MQKLLTFFSKNINIYVIFNDQSFNDTLTNDIVSFEQLGPGILIAWTTSYIMSTRMLHTVRTTAILFTVINDSKFRNNRQHWLIILVELYASVVK